LPSPQALYATLHAVATASGVPVGDALPELYTDGFDVEQVWQQVCREKHGLSHPLVDWGGAGEEDIHNQVADSYPLDDEQHTNYYGSEPAQEAPARAAPQARAHTRCCVYQLTALGCTHPAQIDLRLAPVLSRVKRSLRATARAVGEAPPRGGAHDGDGAAAAAAALFPGVPAPGGRDTDAHGADDEDGEEEEGEEGDEAEDDEDLGEEEAEEEDVAPRGRGRRLPTEDTFFRLQDMEAFVMDAEEAEAAAAERRQRRGDDPDADGDGADEEGGEGDEEDVDDEELFFSAAAPDEDADPDLDAAVAYSAALGGGAKARKAGAKRLKLRGSRSGVDPTDDGDEGDEGPTGDGLRYEDFFGPRKPRGRGRDDDAGGEGGEWEEQPDGEDGDPDDGDAEPEEDEEEADPADAEPADDDDGMASLSAFARRQARLGAQVRALEAANLGPKDWFMRGEVRGGDRPLNSALEVAMDFEHASAPPPVVTEDVTRSLEDLIKARITERRFDDVVRKLPPPPGRKRRQMVLQDEKSSKGLADVYEEQYLKEKAAADAASKAAAAVATGGASSAAAAADTAPAEEASPEAREARALFAALCAKLDSLSHFQFAPKPVVEDLQVSKRDVPALTMEEVAPALVSTATLRAPEEVYAGGQGAGKAAGGVHGSAAGVVKADEELTRGEKSARRARKKRKGMASAAVADAKRRLITTQRQAVEAAAVAAGFKPATSQLASAGPRAPRSNAQQSEYGKSSKVFARLQDEADAAKAGDAAPHVSAAKRLKDAVKARHGGAFNASALKL
jgi:U3 small nucleolar RNA-associated protein MPP10